jgi:hypothetical protein
MKNKTGLFITILGVAILGATIGYQAETSESFMIPVGLAVTFFGIFTLIRNKLKK